MWEKKSETCGQTKMPPQVVSTCRHFFLSTPRPFDLSPKIDQIKQFDSHLIIRTVIILPHSKFPWIKFIICPLNFVWIKSMRKSGRLLGGYKLKETKKMKKNVKKIVRSFSHLLHKIVISWRQHVTVHDHVWRWY